MREGRLNVRRPGNRLHHNTGVSLLDPPTAGAASKRENPFSGTVAAGLYQVGRPYHHPRALQRIRRIVGTERVNRALDVACGTGLSTVALAEIAVEVVGIDTVSEMIALARHQSNVEYLVAPAEEMPFEADSFDAVTVASGVHWFDQQRFYQEAHRVLRPGGWLAIYDHYFGGEILDDTTFEQWTTERYLKELSTPARGPKFDPRKIIPDGYVILGDESYEDPIHMSHESLVSYLLTQSNCIAALRGGRTSLPGLRQWLRQETKQFFPTEGDVRTFRFSGSISCLQSTRPS